MSRFDWSFMTNHQFMQLVEQQAYARTFREGYKRTAEIIFKKFNVSFTPSQICNRYTYLRRLQDNYNSSITKSGVPIKKIEEQLRKEIGELANEIWRLRHQNLLEFLKMKFQIFISKKSSK